MLTESETQLILSEGYVPEHSLDLMVSLSAAKPGILDGFVYFVGRNLVILVGYPIGKPFNAMDLDKVVSQLTERFNPTRISLIAPDLPSRLSCGVLEQDMYYVIPLVDYHPKPALVRHAEKAAQTIRLELSRTYTGEHQALALEMISRGGLTPRVEALFANIGAFVTQTQSARVLNAWTHKSKLSAFYVLDLAPRHFSVYVIGGHSKKHYVPRASDLLFHEMIELSKSHNKTLIHLGLGVNEGICRFKKKWGGVPFLPYHTCDITMRGPSLLESVSSLLNL